MIAAALTLVVTLAQAQAHPGELVARLQEVARDYREAREVDADEARALGASLAEEALDFARDLAPPTSLEVRGAAHVLSLVRSGATAFRVERSVEQLVRRLAARHHLPLSPPAPPDLSHGAALFGPLCGTCHEPATPEQREVAAALRPEPPSFHDLSFAPFLSPFRAFMALTHGVAGSGMPAFSSLSEGDRWALAFYVAAVRHPRCETRSPTAPSLRELAHATDDLLEARHGQDALACLRWQSSGEGAKRREGQVPVAVRPRERH